MDIWLDQGLDARGYEKHGGTQFFLGASHSNVDSPVMSTVEDHQLFAHFLSTLPPTPFASLASFPLLHSLGHHTRLVIDR
jgi:hypothetical protein